MYEKGVFHGQGPSSPYNVLSAEERGDLPFSLRCAGRATEGPRNCRGVCRRSLRNVVVVVSLCLPFLLLLRAIYSYTMNCSTPLLTPTSASDGWKYSLPQPKILRGTRLQSPYYAVSKNQTKRTADALQNSRCAPESGVAVKSGHLLDWSEW